MCVNVILLIAVVIFIFVIVLDQLCLDAVANNPITVAPKPTNKQDNTQTSTRDGADGDKVDACICCGNCFDQTCAHIASWL